MKLEEAIPALRAGARINRSSISDAIVEIAGGLIVVTDPSGSTELPPEMGVFTLDDILAEDWLVTMPAKAEGHADANARGEPTEDRPVPGHGGICDLTGHAIVHNFDTQTRKNRTYLDSLEGPELVSVDGRWLYADPALPAKAE